MNPYEEILKIMRNEGKKDNPPPIKMGTMESPTVCNIGDLKVEGSDLLITEHLKGMLKKGDMVAVYRKDEETYIILERLVEL